MGTGEKGTGRGGRRWQGDPSAGRPVGGQRRWSTEGWPLGGGAAGRLGHRGGDARRGDITYLWRSGRGERGALGKSSPPPAFSREQGDSWGCGGGGGVGGLRANLRPEAEVPAVQPAIPLGCGKSGHLGSRGGHTVPLTVPLRLCHRDPSCCPPAGPSAAPLRIAPQPGHVRRDGATVSPRWRAAPAP